MATISFERVATLENNSGSGGTNLVYQITLSQALSDEVTVEYLIENGTAVDADLWVASSQRSGSVTITAGETTALLTVRTYGDSLDEADESVWLTLFNPVGATFSGGENSLTALGVINDNDGTGSDLAMFVSSPRMVEEDNGNKMAVFEIHLSDAAASDLTFNYRTIDGTAKSGEDYTAKTGSVTFLSGQTTVSVEIPIKGDTKVEASEFFSLVVTPTADIKNETQGSTGIGTILDDDGRAGLPVISAQRSETTENNSGSGGTDVTFEISLSEASDEEITLNYQSIAGSGVNVDLWPQSFSSGSVTFEAGETTQLLKFRTYGDSADEFDESFWLKLSNARNAVLAGGGKTQTAIGIIKDNDGSGSNLSLFVSNPEITEGNNGQKLAVFEVHLSQAYDSNLTFQYQTADGTAKAGSDYVAEKGNVTFRAGQTVASLEIAIKGDAAVEQSEQFSLVVKTTDEVKNGAAFHVGKATILNDDSIHQTIEGNARANKLYGRDGNDTLYGLDGNDLLDGGTGNDLLIGGAGKDTLFGGKGQDDLRGGANGDRFLFKELSDSTVKPSGRDMILDFNGKSGDRIDISDIDAIERLSRDQKFDFIGGREFSREAGQLRVDKSNGDTFIYGEVDGDRKADFAIRLDGSIRLIDDFFIL